MGPARWFVFYWGHKEVWTRMGFEKGVKATAAVADVKA